MQCACSAYWFHRFHERISFDGPDDVTTWYTRLTTDEATAIVQAEKPDLKFLTTRASIMIDASGVRCVDGQPDHTYGGT